MGCLQGDRFPLLIWLLAILGGFAGGSSLSRAEELPGYQDLVPPLPQAAGAAEAAKNKVQPERLTLKKALEKAMQKNRTFLKAKITFLKAEIEYAAARDDLYLPTLSLSLAGKSTTTLGEMKRTGGPTLAPSGYKQGYPDDGATSITLDLKKNLFNNFSTLKDYQGKKFVYDTARENWANALRDLRFNIFEKMFNARIGQDKVDLANVSLQVAEAVLANVQAKKRAGKAQDADVSSAEVAVTEAKTKINEFQTELRSSLRELNLVLGDPVGTPYIVVTDDVRYNPVQISAEEAWATYVRYSSQMRGRKQQLRDAEASFEETRRWFFPTITADLSVGPRSVDWAHHYYGTVAGPVGGSSTVLEATVDLKMTWEILSPSRGFLSGRTLEKARLDYENARLSFIDDVSNDQSSLMGELDSIRQLEVSVTNTEKKVIETSKILDSLVQQLRDGSVNQLELRSAIDNVRDAQSDRYKSMLDHMKQKRAFAAKIGLNQFPGDAF